MVFVCISYNTCNKTHSTIFLSYYLQCWVEIWFWHFSTSFQVSTVCITNVLTKLNGHGSQTKSRECTYSGHQVGCTHCLTCRWRSLCYASCRPCRWMWSRPVTRVKTCVSRLNSKNRHVNLTYLLLPYL